MLAELPLMLTRQARCELNHRPTHFICNICGSTAAANKFHPQRVGNGGVQIQRSARLITFDNCRKFIVRSDEMVVC